MSALNRLGLKPEQLKSQDNKQISAEQAQTSDSFGFKWAKEDSYASEAMQNRHRSWMLDKYFDGDTTALERLLPKEKGLIIDAGCGAGYSSLILFGDLLKHHDYLGLDISTAVEVASKRFAAAGLPGEFWQTDIQTVELPDHSVDLIFSEGVLHHTDNTRKTFLHLAKKLKPGGSFVFYVYAKKGALREFSDDHIRNWIKDMSNQEAWDALKPLTALGIELGRLDINIDVPEDIPFFGIKQGSINLQRLFYWHISKMFYAPELSFDEMQHINFDWYRPTHAHRHNPEEVREWCQEAGLKVQRLHVEEAGISVIATRPA